MGPHSFKCGNMDSASLRVCLRRLASMGPHSFKCGNERKPCFGGVLCPWLQWGRTLSSAETRARCSTISSKPSLQWGRTLSSAETVLFPADRLPLGIASMGPHSFKCGNSAKPFHRLQLPCGLQWGRTLSSAETIAVEDVIQDAILASMGPHSFKCGNEHTGNGSRVGWRGFNGAALFQVRKQVAADLEYRLQG